MKKKLMRILSFPCSIFFMASKFKWLIRILQCLSEWKSEITKRRSARNLSSFSVYVSSVWLVASKQRKGKCSRHPPLSKAYSCYRQLVNISSQDDQVFCIIQMRMKSHSSRQCRVFLPQKSVSYLNLFSRLVISALLLYIVMNESKRISGLLLFPDVPIFITVQWHIQARRNRKWRMDHSIFFTHFIDFLLERKFLLLYSACSCSRFVIKTSSFIQL
jgi:hypothetical protein